MDIHGDLNKHYNGFTWVHYHDGHHDIMDTSTRATLDIAFCRSMVDVSWSMADSCQLLVLAKDYFAGFTMVHGHATSDICWT